MDRETGYRRDLGRFGLRRVGKWAGRRDPVGKMAKMVWVATVFPEPPESSGFGGSGAGELQKGGTGPVPVRFLNP